MYKMYIYMYQTFYKIYQIELYFAINKGVIIFNSLNSQLADETKTFSRLQFLSHSSDDIVYYMYLKVYSNLNFLYMVEFHVHNHFS